MTKTEILTALNTFISAVGLVNKTRHTGANTTIVDEIYPTAVTDSNETEAYTTNGASAVTYNIKIIKSGNIAHISGSIDNQSGTYSTPFVLFTWKENQFKASTGDIYFVARNATETVRMKLNENGLSTFSMLPTQEFNFEFITYITQD